MRHTPEKESRHGMPRARGNLAAQGFLSSSPVVVRVGREQRSRWEAVLEPGESLSELVRLSVDRELERRRQEQERRAADRFGLDGLLEQPDAGDPPPTSWGSLVRAQYRP
jgi:hypothetical protein